MERQRKTVEQLNSFKDWEGRYRELIERGKRMPPLPEPEKTEAHRIRGCQSQVWLLADLLANGEIEFRADSDALIVKGLASLAVEIYSFATPAEILQSPPTFIKESGLDQHLSPTRAGGFHSIIKQIMFYATAYQHLAKKL